MCRTCALQACRCSILAHEEEKLRVSCLAPPAGLRGVTRSVSGGSWQAGRGKEEVEAADPSSRENRKETAFPPVLFRFFYAASFLVNTCQGARGGGCVIVCRMSRHEGRQKKTVDCCVKIILSSRGLPCFVLKCNGKGSWWPPPWIWLDCVLFITSRWLSWTQRAPFKITQKSLSWLLGAPS